MRRIIRPFALWRTLSLVLLLLAPQIAAAQGASLPPDTQGSEGEQSGSAAAPDPSEPPAFDVDALNAGLGDAPADLDRSTPQGTMEALLDLNAARAWGPAAHLLDLGFVDEAEQPLEGSRRARELVEILNRKVVLDWSDLPDRPDALVTRSDNPMAGQARRSILLGTVEMRGRPVELRLNRVRPPEGDPVWVISRQTVANIPVLHDRYGPTALEMSLPEQLRQEAIWGLMRWELLGLPLVLGIAVLAGVLTSRLMRLLASRANGKLVTSLLRAARRPLIVFAFTATLTWLTGTYFVFSGRIDMLLGPLRTIGFTLAGLVFLLNGVDEILDRLISPSSDALFDAREGHRRELATNIAAGRRVLVVVVVIFGLGIILSRAELFRGLGLSLLASAGALTLVFGFAARQVLGNILSSLQIAFNRSARIGDKIMYRDHLCYVERINFTYVQLREWTDVRIVVPVSEFVSEPFENWTLADPKMIRFFKIRLSHTAKVERLREAFFEIVDAMDPEELQERENHFVSVTDHDVFGQEVMVALACANADTAWALSCEVREKLLIKAAEFEGESGGYFPQPSAAEGAA
ncbi:mechanosensitive ion channel family protein [Pseudoroseicyclus aestuarii]|uniref:Small-conductance mechanosensitive channel n=1 Tax=Pseudoroseicyclus aestuarii TaxID=1795041 RepID=A0A318SWI7_9RHOB|nr:mechanosensitive ion channel domain-containing protein [Pseudoroseicyclus aestuarii]PYE85872.1 small-conductance mechanosensitive channel [Pseudoroseicyclus aestuarii]